MFSYLTSLTSRRRSEDGASAVEYGLLVALIAAVIVIAVFTLVGTIKSAFTDTNNCITDGQAGTECTPGGDAG